MGDIPKRKKLTAEDIAAAASRGEDISRHFSGKGKMRPGFSLQRVNVDFTVEMLGELDQEARRLNISRQAVIKTMLADALDRRALARKK